MNAKPPVLLLIWKRPQSTKKVFAQIRKYKPRILFVAADGPRNNISSDKKVCLETRKVTEKIDWKCSVKRLYRDSNLGLKQSVSEAISWFFEYNKEGIILEDDCLPNLSFFDFCSQMLARYRSDERVMHISGDNFQSKRSWNPKSYYFSRYPHIWGWATWQRAWNKYLVDIPSPNIIKATLDFDYYSFGFWEKMYWSAIFKAVYANKINTWDYQWIYAVWTNHGLSINPGVNLVSNIGFGEGAVHTVSSESDLSKIATTGMAEKLPEVDIKTKREFDIYTSQKVFRISPFSALSRKLYYSLPIGN